MGSDVVTFTDNREKVDVLIIDGSQWLFAYSIMLQPLWNSDAIDVSVIFYTIRKIYTTITRFKPKEVYVVFDIGRDLKKKRKFEKYKQHRNIASKYQGRSLDRLQYERLQFSRKAIYHILETTPIKPFLVPYVEGDTLIAFIAKTIRKTKPNANIVIVSSDKDMFQLIDERTSILIRSTTTGIEELITYYNFDRVWEAVIGKNLNLQKIVTFTSNQPISYSSIPYYRAFLGDISDGIPGIKGYGSSTIGYLTQFQQFIGKVNFDSSEDFKEWLLSNKELILDNYGIINKIAYNKTKRMSKNLTQLLDNFEDIYDEWKVYFELIDFEHAINELSPSVYQALYEDITNNKDYNETEFLSIIREYDLNSTNDYMYWSLVNKVLLSGNWEMVNIPSATTLELLFNKLVNKCFVKED